MDEPESPTPMRGLGDVVAAVTSAVGIKTCGGCKKRQEALNRLVPFKQNPGEPDPLPAGDSPGEKMPSDPT